MAGQAVLKTVSQDVISGTTQNLYVGGVLADGSDAPISISSSKVVNLANTTTLNGNSISTYSDAPAFYAVKTSGQAVSQNVNTKIIYDNEYFDSNSCFTNSRFTPNVAGIYFIQYQLYCSSDANFRSYIFKNGSQIRMETHTYNYSGLGFCTHLVYLNGTTDYIEIYGYPYNAGRTFDADANFTHFAGFLVRKL